MLIERQSSLVGRKIMTILLGAGNKYLDVPFQVIDLAVRVLTRGEMLSQKSSARLLCCFWWNSNRILPKVACDIYYHIHLGPCLIKKNVHRR